MEALTGFAVLSLLSSLLLSLLPETRLKSTVHLVASLLLLLSWLTALQTLCTRFSQPESSASAASPLPYSAAKRCASSRVRKGWGKSSAMRRLV